MIRGANEVAFAILVVSFLVVTVIGFAAARWRPAENPMHLNEWGLGGRGFGTFISWFLLGGDLYTAYTFIAVLALQLVGIEWVLIVLGVGSTSSNVVVKDLPLIIAFTVLAAYTYLAGLRAPALIAFVKDALIYLTVIVAIVYIPGRLGGWGHIFGAASAHLKTINQATGKPKGSP